AFAEVDFDEHAVPQDGFAAAFVGADKLLVGAVVLAEEPRVPRADERVALFLAGDAEHVEGAGFAKALQEIEVFVRGEAHADEGRPADQAELGVGATGPAIVADEGEVPPEQPALHVAAREAFAQGAGAFDGRWAWHEGREDRETLRWCGNPRGLASAGLFGLAGVAERRQSCRRRTAHDCRTASASVDPAEQAAEGGGVHRHAAAVAL